METFVRSFTHLKDRPKADQALQILQRIASLVKPIMRKHHWVLPVLAEFFPDSQNLVGLNVNGGEKILLRLRPAWAPDTFYEEDQVVRVMLHELTHNVHGPHDEKFYKFLAGLEEEYDALKRSGYAGEGFFSKGRRLGADVSHNLSPHLARLKAVEAAEKRRELGNIMKSGGRLGGRPIAGLSARELAAQAALRRANDDKACGSGIVAEREAAKAAKESVGTNVVDLTREHSLDASTQDARKSPAQPLQSHPVASSSSLIQRDLRSEVVEKQAMVGELSASLEWTCPICTLINNHFALQCDACQSERPPDRESTWSCLVCGERGMPHEFWTCRFCGTVKPRS